MASSRQGNPHRRTGIIVFLLKERSTSFSVVCEGVVVPGGERERTQGYQLCLETAPVIFGDFLLLLELSYGKLEETGKEKKEEE